MFVSIATPGAMLAALAAPLDGSAPGGDTIYLWIAMAAGVLALAAALLFARSVLAADQGTPDMQEIAAAIREGAEAFMGRQYKTIAIMALVLAAVLFAGYRMYGFNRSSRAEGGLQLPGRRGLLGNPPAIPGTVRPPISLANLRTCRRGHATPASLRLFSWPCMAAP